MSTNVILGLVGIAIIIIETLVIVVIVKSKKKETNKLKGSIDKLEAENISLEVKLKSKSKSIEAIKKHSERVNLTKRQLKPIQKKIREAKTDEETLDAISAVISRNNKRLFNDKD